jgi:glyoxylase-like metal-dependent hydrolase (beta-lactamase superfamily II)
MRLILLLVFILSSLLAPAAAGAGEEMSLYVLNVGKADSMILRSGENIYLIDTGRGSTMDVTESALKEEGITHLDAVIITHMDSDHVGGLKKLLKSDVTLDHIYVPAYFLQEEKDKENPAIKAGFSPFRKCCPKFYCDSPFFLLVTFTTLSYPISQFRAVHLDTGHSCHCQMIHSAQRPRLFHLYDRGAS